MPHRSSNREMWNSISSVVLLLCYKHFFIFRLTSQWYSLASELEWMTMQIYSPGGDYQKCQLVKFINERWCEERTKSPFFDQFWTGKCCDIGIREAQAKLRTKAEEKKIWRCIQKQILFAVQKWGNKDFEVLKLALQVEVGLKLLGK